MAWGIGKNDFRFSSGIGAENKVEIKFKDLKINYSKD